MRRIQLAKYWPLFWYLLYFDLWNQTVALSDFSLYSKVFVLCMQLCFPVTQHHFCRASFAFTEWVPSRQRVVTGVRPPPVHIVHRPPPSLTCRLLTTYLIFHRWRTTSRWSSSWRSSSAWRERCSEWKIINRSEAPLQRHQHQSSREGAFLFLDKTKLSGTKISMEFTCCNLPLNYS